MNDHLIEKRNRISRSGTNAIVGILAVMLLMITLTGNSYGWFSNNTDASANGARVQIKEDKSIIVSRLIVYKYKIEDNRMYASIDDPNSPEYMILNQYDTVFTERLQYTPMILKVPLELTLGEKFYVSFVCDGELYADDTTKLLNELSNVIRVRCGSSETLDEAYPTDSTESEAATTNFYNDAKTFFETSTNKAEYITNEKWCEGRFVTYIKEGGTITSLAKNKPSATYTGMIQMEATGCNIVDYKESETQQVNLYMYIDYDPNLVAKYVSDNDFAFDKGSVRTFKGDIASVTFSRTNDVPQ